MEKKDLQSIGFPDDPNKRETAAVAFALRSKGIDAVDFLVSNKGISLDMLLCFSAQLNLVDVMTTLVEIHGARVIAMVPRVRFSTTPLITATEEGAVAATKWLLEHGADIERGSQTPHGSYILLCEQHVR